MLNARAQELPANANLQQQQADDEQYATRSRPVSFYDNYKDAPTMAPCVTSAMSDGNLSQVRDGDAPETVQENNNSNNNNNKNNNNNNDYRNSRVGNAISAGNITKIQTSKVKGAVSTGNIGKMYRSEKEKELGRAPSMANCLSTTVPVNLAAAQIAGRHTPTRNSLRHSRMIVLHRTGNLPRKAKPALLGHPCLAKSLAGMQMFIGITITSLSLFLLLWTPSLQDIDNPYWSGLPLFISGSFGICLLCCFKKEYPRMSPGFCLTTTKILSAFLSIVAAIACIIVCIATIVHLVRLSGLECSSTSLISSGSCVCGTIINNSTLTREPILKYYDLTCSEVNNLFTYLLIFSASCNALGIIVATWYSYLHWNSQKQKPQYFQVRSNINSAGSSLNSRQIYNPNHNGR
ncbi:uncharacterized protein LOC127288591 [Leptopilina boulardi]|uniref:uncharacterized protein LOC127288591 n=1 Tax=Leptopilina boulardi TaxID=63433 RepID=UPI0021F5548B|nr:uncharacterized protein LOC127288591 [Leptopilina boulardi]